MSDLPVVFRIGNTSLPGGQSYLVSEDIDPLIKVKVGDKLVEMSKTIFASAENSRFLIDRIVTAELLTGVINGSNATFTTVFDFVPETVRVYVNGLRQRVTVHFHTVGTRTVVFADSPVSLDVIESDYLKQ